MQPAISNALEPEIQSGRPEYRSFLRFAQLEHEKRRLEAQLKQIHQEMEALEPQLKDYLGAEGYQRVRIAGFTIYIRRSLYARAQPGCDQQTICSALKRNGMGHFVVEQYLVSRLSAHVRDLEELHKDQLDSGSMRSIAEALPPEVAAVVNVEPTYDVIAMRRP